MDLTIKILQGVLEDNKKELEEAKASEIKDLLFIKYLEGTIYGMEYSLMVINQEVREV